MRSVKTVLPTCKHVIPTIEYCPDASEAVSTFEAKRKLGASATPPSACTDSYGWSLFERLEAPVVCEGCKMWLHMNGKQTYGQMVSRPNSKGVSEVATSPETSVGRARACIKVGDLAVLADVFLFCVDGIGGG